MKTYRDKIIEIREDALLALKEILKKRSTINLFDFSRESWYEDESYMDLPQCMNFLDHGMYDYFYLCEAYLKNDKVYFKGYHDETADYLAKDLTEEFIDTLCLCEFIDQVMEVESACEI